MKLTHLFFALLVFLVAAATHAVSGDSGVGQFSMVNTSTTVPKQLTNVTMRVSSVTLIGKSSNQGAANAGSVFVGFSSTDGANVYEIASGTVHVFTPAPGRYLDLSTIYVDVANANDGLAIIWEN